MAVDTKAQTTTWTYVDGDWHEGNVPIIGPRTHAMWLGSSVFDGARWFEGVAPDLDLHAARFLGPAARWFTDLMAALIVLLVGGGFWLYRLRGISGER